MCRWHEVLVWRLSSYHDSFEFFLNFFETSNQPMNPSRLIFRSARIKTSPPAGSFFDIERSFFFKTSWRVKTSRFDQTRLVLNSSNAPTIGKSESRGFGFFSDSWLPIFFAGTIGNSVIREVGLLGPSNRPKSPFTGVFLARLAPWFRKTASSEEQAGPRNFGK